MKAEHISVVGLGKLGSPLVGVLANAGHHVIGVDVNSAFVSALNAGKAPVTEPQLDDYITQHSDRISATADYHHAILNTNITFIIVPTPSLATGFFDNSYVVKAIEAIGESLRHKDSRHLIVITSTVMPTSMDRIIVPALERAAGKKVGTDIGLCYSPHFIALGTVIKNMEYPDFILVGESDSQSGQQLEQLYRHYCKNEPSIQHMNFVNAEITKISVNSYITTKISFANMLSDLCDQLPGANVDVITDSMGLDKRIGRAYLKAGSAYGGPCFPRDNIAFSKFAKLHHVPADIAISADSINNHQLTRISKLVNAYEATTISILGLSYKTDCDFALVSFGVALANHLATHGKTVSAYDPHITSPDQTMLDATVVLCQQLEEALTQDFIVLTLADPSMIDRLHSYMMKHPQRQFVVVDCWRSAHELDTLSNCNVIAMGVGQTHAVPKIVSGEFA